MLKAIRFFFAMGWRYDKRYILYRIFHELVRCLIPIVATVAPKLFIDELMGQARPERLVLWAGLLAGYTLAATAMCSYFSSEGFTRRCRVDAAFGLDRDRNLARADYANLEDPGFLNQKARAERFLTCGWHGFGYLLDLAINILGQCATLAGIAAMIAALNGWMILIFALLALLGAVVEARVKKKTLELSQHVAEDQRGWVYYSGLFSDVKYAKEIRLYRMGDWLLGCERRFTRRAIDNIAWQNRLTMASGLCSAGFTFIQQCSAYGYLAFQVTAGQIGLGSFTMYAAAVTAFSSALRQIMDSMVEIRQYDTYYDDLDEYLNFPAVLRQGKAKAPRQGRLVFDHVCFQYPGAQQKALEDLCLTLEPGEKLAVVGENGAGKTTFVKLLCRLYDPDSGRILLDGRDIRDFDYDSYMALLSAVFQDYRLYACSLRENIALGERISDGEIWRALEQLGLRRWVESMPRGLDTPISRVFDPEGFEPSGGEGQKIALARALVRKTSLVILDEPTAALDPRAEDELYRQFDQLIQGRSAVYITHRMASTRFCDKIAVFERGRLVQYGSHKALMQQEGLYRELYLLQAAHY